MLHLFPISITAKRIPMMQFKIIKFALLSNWSTFVIVPLLSVVHIERIAYRELNVKCIAICNIKVHIH